jgi:hypothetical protein
VTGKRYKAIFSRPGNTKTISWLEKTKKADFCIHPVVKRQNCCDYCPPPNSSYRRRGCNSRSGMDNWHGRSCWWSCLPTSSAAPASPAASTSSPPAKKWKITISQQDGMQITLSAAGNQILQRLHHSHAILLHILTTLTTFSPPQPVSLSHPSKPLSHDNQSLSCPTQSLSCPTQSLSCPSRVNTYILQGEWCCGGGGGLIVPEGQ